jgi:hypothetical protein
MTPTMANKPATIPRVTAVSHSIVSLDPICGTGPAQRHLCGGWLPINGI